MKKNIISERPVRQGGGGAVKTVPADESALSAAAAVLLSGGVAVIPTDTVYGLAAHPAFPKAVARLYTIKGREEKKPIALLAASAEATGVDHPLTAKWPGGLTIVSGGEGYRVPDYEWTRRLLEKCGGLLRVTSANLSGRVSATDAVSTLADVGLGADLVVDGGVSPGGVPSTVVRLLKGGEVEILRQGGVDVGL